jgi:hypothetical protein
MILGSSPHNTSLRNLIAQIRLLAGPMHINYFHVLRINNVEADKLANKAIGKAPGHLGVNGRDTHPFSMSLSLTQNLGPRCMGGDAWQAIASHALQRKFWGTRAWYFNADERLSSLWEVQSFHHEEGRWYSSHRCARASQGCGFRCSEGGFKRNGSDDDGELSRCHYLFFATLRKRLARGFPSQIRYSLNPWFNSSVLSPHF